MVVYNKDYATVGDLILKWRILMHISSLLT